MGRATSCRSASITRFKYFNPRPPWGGRPELNLLYHVPNGFQSTPSVGRATFEIHYNGGRTKFQSTPSVGRATRERGQNRSGHSISIHALRGEGDEKKNRHKKLDKYFNPRPPWGGRQQNSKSPNMTSSISIHALRGEGDCKNIQICNAMLVHSAYKTVYFCDSCAFYLT